MTDLAVVAPAPVLDFALPCRPLDNQPEEWISYKDGVHFDVAAQRWHEERTKDGAIRDIQVHDLSTYGWEFMPGQTMALVPGPAAGRSRDPIPLRHRAWVQLCQAINAPVSYLNRLPAKVQAVCVNTGLRELAKQSRTRGALVRTVRGEARAIVSERYAPLDGERVIDTLRRVLHASGQLDSVRVRSLAVGETASFRLTFPEHDSVIVGSPKVGDIVEVGLDILNGETGNRSLSLSPLAWRLVCLNGMRTPLSSDDAARFLHVGDPERLHSAFEDALPVAIEGGQRVRETMQRSVDLLVDDLLSEFDLGAFGLSPADAQDVARDVMAERSVMLPMNTGEWGEVLAEFGDVTVYDVANGITHVAQSRPTDRRIEMEEAGFRYMERRVRLAN